MGQWAHGPWAHGPKVVTQTTNIWSDTQNEAKLNMQMSLDLLPIKTLFMQVMLLKEHVAVLFLFDGQLLFLSVFFSFLISTDRYYEINMPNSKAP